MHNVQLRNLHDKRLSGKININKLYLNVFVASDGLRHLDTFILTLPQLYLTGEVPSYSQSST